jgi:hypothetical protein
MEVKPQINGSETKMRVEWKFPGLKKLRGFEV